jgi:hypothetical protein
MRKLENTITHLHSKVISLKRKNSNLKDTVKHKKKRRKRGKALIEQFRAEEGKGVLFLLPTKIQAIRDLDAQREAQKEAKQAAKQLAKEDKQQ